MSVIQSVNNYHNFTATCGEMEAKIKGADQKTIGINRFSRYKDG